MFEKYRNANGTYNGAAAMADMTGLSQAEILWTFNRLKELRALGVSSDDAKAIVLREQKAKPWRSPDATP